MAEGYGELAERLKELEKQFAEKRDRTGGVLSSKDFENLVIATEKDAQKYEELKTAFVNRDWKKVGRRFIIEPYDALNLTPFSYDLSIGDEIFSVQKPDRIRKRLPYPMAPGETVILLTKEYVALPPCYSATIWPRFNLVREGIFQSMVKIDPTWYGHLGVAASNLSPRTVPLKEDMAFGTLVLYELSSDTNIDLWQPEKLPTVRVKIPDIPLRGNLQQELRERKLTSICWVEGDELVVRGLKKSSYEKLYLIDNSQPWQETARRAKEAWLKCSHPTTKRKSIGMDALEMKDLANLIEGSPMGESVDPEKVRVATVTPDALRNTAVEYGKPFDLVAAIPASILQQVRKELVPSIEAEVGARLFPHLVQLTLRVLALLSLIGVAIALSAKYFDVKNTWLGVVAVSAIPLMLIFLIFIFGKFPRQKENWTECKQSGSHNSVPTGNTDIEAEYRCPKLVSFVLRLLSPLKKK